jgi:hypothetical protein
MPHAFLLTIVVASALARSAGADDSIAAAALPAPVRLLRELAMSKPDCRACGALFLARTLWSDAGSERNARRRVVLWDQAARAYAIAARLGLAGGLDATQLDEAGYDAVRGWLFALDVGKEPLKRLATQLAKQPPKSQAIPVRERLLLDAIAFYLPRAAPDVDTISIRYERGALLRRYGHLTEAIPELQAVVAARPRNEYAGRAALLLLDALVRAGDRQALREQIDAVRADRDLASDGALREYLDQLAAAASAGASHR